MSSLVISEQFKKGSSISDYLASNDGDARRALMSYSDVLLRDADRLRKLAHLLENLSDEQMKEVVVKGHVLAIEIEGPKSILDLASRQNLITGG